MAVVDNNGVAIHFEVHGSLDHGVPLVLHHGRLGHGDIWHKYGYVTELAADRAVITLDARGHGRSSRPHDPTSYAASHMASDIVAVLDEVDVECADLFGYSMGGRIGFMALTFVPERIRSLIAGGAAPFGPALNREEELKLASTLADGIEAYLTQFEVMLQHPIPEPERSEMLDNDPVAMSALARQGADWPNVVKRVAASETPIQLFGASNSPVWPLIEQANEQLPNATLVSFDGLGPGDELRQPDLILPLVHSFLATL
ncbi:MAG: pimeloyl-ACP methyl ester carboxylesterase [Acidimicrobiales bacterium]|jgi:pimeloyl-ACP methyl ester carboxylesterase